jgi:iron-sulfur cluster repair protein YtfE (RIC family)
MSFLEKLAETIFPGESDDDRIQARAEATKLARPGDWLAEVLHQHREIDLLFSAALSANGEQQRTAALKKLGQHLTAHSMAEEVVLYPAIANSGDRGDAAMAYEEQSAAKVEMAALESIDPGSVDWHDKLTAIRDAVAHHVYHEEATWYPRLHQATAASDTARLTARFAEEYGRHSDMHSNVAAAGSPRHEPAQHRLA